MNIIDRYTDLMAEVTDASEDFNKSIALTMLSLFSKRNFVFMSAPDASLFNLNYQTGRYLNLWFILIGVSRVSRKSTCISKAEELVNSINKDVLLPTDFTPQSLISDLSSKYDPNLDCCRALWINDECSGFFEQLNNGGFMTATDAILSRLYDCRNFTRRTIKRGKETIINPYLNILLASTEWLPSLFSEGQLRQGFLNRFVFVISRKNKRKELKPYLSDWQKREANEIRSWFFELEQASTLRAMVFDGEAKKVYNKFEQNVEHKLIEDRDEKMSDKLGVKEGYFSNLPNFVTRIACLRHIGSMNYFDSRKYITIVDKHDVGWAIDFIKTSWDYFNEIVYLMKTTPVHQPMRVDNRIEMVYELIKKGYSTKSDLLVNSKIKTRDLSSILDTLLEEDRIERKIERSKTKPKVVYKIRKKT